MLAKIATDKEEFQQAEVESPGIVTELWRGWKTGAGMFCESYFIFSVGNLPTIWKDMYTPTCYSTAATADPTCYQGTTAIPYVPVAGIIVGMVSFGLASDHLGRRWGSRLTVSFMLLGSIIITIANGTSLSGQFVMFNIGMFLFAYGVGGEYPMASSTASERSETEKLPRGRTVAFTFANQGWGNTVNTAITLFMLAVTNTGGCNTSYAVGGKVSLNSTYKVSSSTTDPATVVGGSSGESYQNEYCNLYQMEVAWRLSLGLGIPVVAGLWVYRWFILNESVMWVDRQEKKYSSEERAAIRLRRIQNTRLLFGRKYLPRLIGAAGGWFLWDVAFYGNKLFQTNIINSIVGATTSPSLLITFEYTLLNAVVALVGYYVAAATIDKPWMGRVRMQNMGFAVCAAFFLACGYNYAFLTQPANVNGFLVMYLITSFWGQWGPNVTTWLLPVELFPTDVRAQAHGFSAASGKLGALMATLIFTYGNNGGKPTNDQVFEISGYFTLAGFVITVLFVPDITNVPLAEIERRWSMDRRAALGETSGAVVATNEA